MNEPTVEQRLYMKGHAVTVPELVEGDYVLQHGCLFRVSDRKESTTYGTEPCTPENGGNVVWFKATLVTRFTDFFPKSWENSYGIQGNSYARVSRIPREVVEG